VGRYGPFVQAGDAMDRASVPDDTPPDELTVARALELIEQASHSDHLLGEDPETGKPVYVKAGRFGPYVQLGDPELTRKGQIKKGSKPKMASLWPTMSVEMIGLEEALMLLSFPREIGTHPDTGEIITAQDGRFGPYIKMGKESRSLGSHDRLATVTLEEAVALLKEPPSRARRSSSSVLADLGRHPQTDDAIQVKSGRYGPYVTDGVVNATLPKGRDPASVKLEEALELIAAREQKLKDQGKDSRAKATATPAGKARKSASTTRKKAKKKTSKKKTAGSRTKDNSESFGTPPEGFAWTRTGKPVVEDWPEGTLACPNCGSDLVLKAGRFGPFFSCTGYPKCKTSINLRGQAKKRAEQEMGPAPDRPPPQPTDVICDKCGAHMVIRSGRGGSFLGCSGYPNCRSTKPLPDDLADLAPRPVEAGS
jgi:topoisomerase IA-like protein